MCGIVGYVGPKPVVPVILGGLRRLEYRGYDSAGIALADGDGDLSVFRAPGKLHNLEALVAGKSLNGGYGLGHTRWATHGRPTEENAHPHRDCTGSLVVVHNGIVENYLSLKQDLEAKGHVFATETDTEIIAHLIEQELLDAGDVKPPLSSLPLEEAVRRAIRKLNGAFAIGVLSAHEPDKLVAARSGPPAVIGFGNGEYFLASDIPGILHLTRNVAFLHDGDLAILTPSGVLFSDFDGNPISRHPHYVHWDSTQAEKEGYPHFMLKEIYEQPRAVRDTMRNHISSRSDNVTLPELKLSAADILRIRRVIIASCGTSWHAGLVAKFMIEQLARLPVEVDYASEFRYRNPILGDTDLGVLISQSGETADTLAAQDEMIANGMPTLAVCNVVGSAIPRKASGAMTTNAGPEIGVASTKAFTAQLTALFVFALYLAQCRNTITSEERLRLLAALDQLPAQVDATLRSSARQCEQLAKQFWNARDFLFLGRGVHYPIALEGALKLKEVSYIHAEGYPAGEMKHGPNALIDETLPVVCIATKAPDDPRSAVRHAKTLSNIQEVTARSGRVIALASEGDQEISRLAEHTVFLPPTAELLLPILEVIPLQLLAYYIAVERGCDVDQPRNLAKSVTVE